MSNYNASSSSSKSISDGSDVKNYGGVDNDKDIPGGCAKRNPTKEEIHDHWMSTLALCSSVFSMFYLVFSIFPYGGFMALQLVPGLKYNSVGTYAGILTGSMKIASVFTAYPWGIISDTYGRKFVLLFSTASSAVLMLAFGFSTNFAYAVAIRILIGLSNATMTIARVSASELAKGNHELEAKGMGLVMSMVGVGMLFAPAIGGLLSEPVTQFPNVDFGRFEAMLLKFPFLLPNLIGTIICTISTIQVAFSVKETLPPERLRSAKYIIPDILSFFSSLPSMIGKNIASWRNDDGGYVEVRSNMDDDATVTSSERNDNISDSERNEELKIIVSYLNEEEGQEVSYVSKSARASFSKALHKPSKRLSEISKSEVPATATIASLMADKKVRECLTCYWVMTFASTANSECFPLFAMAREGGLSLGETSIGTMGAISGLVFCICQYFIFSVSMKYLKLHKTMLFSGFLAVIPAILIPVSLLIPSKTAVIAYLGIINGMLSVFFSNWNAALSITQNRAVHPRSRSRVNGLAAVGTAVARGFGPLFAGVLVTLSYTDGIVPVQYGSLVFYSVVVALGGVAFVINSKLEDDNAED